MPKPILNQKLQHKTQFLSFPVFANLWKKILNIYDSYMAILGPFLVIIWLLHEIISQKRGSDCHFEMLSVSES